MFEVELKFPVVDVDALNSQLQAFQLDWHPVEHQRDQYFRHPSRDFGETNEALRLRNVANQHTLTYKGPVIDRLTKTRREIETDLLPSANSAEAMTATLAALGFTPLRVVEKHRRTATLHWQSRAITCAWDEVPPLGTFLELEIVTDDADRMAAADAILSLAAHLRLPEPERRSYLKLLLQKDGVVPSSTTVNP